MEIVVKLLRMGVTLVVVSFVFVVAIGLVGALINLVVRVFQRVFRTKSP